MALVRILVDGYSLLHQWKQLAPGKPRHSETAREELINRITQYFDATGTPITIVFDGTSGPGDFGAFESTPGVEILFSRPGQTADQLIERLGHRLAEYGEFLVVTDDFAERETVQSLSGLVSTCENFIQGVETTLADLEREIQRLNQRENHSFTHR
jgi:uncharacterized protein